MTILESISNIVNYPTPAWLFLVSALVAGMVLRRVVRSKIRNYEGRNIARNNRIDQELRLLMSANTQLIEQIQGNQKQISLLKEKLDQITLKEPSQKIYEHAIRLVEQSASVETIMDQSGLSRGEVELLCRLRKTSSAKADVA